MLTIGLTGGIGTGKTTVSGILATLGAPVIDADKVGHAVYAPGGPAYDDMVKEFGPGILAADGTIDRRKLGPIVFSNPDALKRLNAIVHPKIYQRLSEMVVAMRAAGERKPIVVEAAILIEAGWQPLFNEIWLTVTSHERIIERVERDRGLKRAETEARMRAQLPDEERRKHASIVISNDGTVEDLRARVAAAWQAALERNDS